MCNGKCIEIILYVVMILTLTTLLTFTIYDTFLRVLKNI